MRHLCALVTSPGGTVLTPDAQLARRLAEKEHDEERLDLPHLRRLVGAQSTPPPARGRLPQTVYEGEVPEDGGK